jgi:hypothetical protein
MVEALDTGGEEKFTFIRKRLIRQTIRRVNRTG